MSNSETVEIDSSFWKLPLRVGVSVGGVAAVLWLCTCLVFVDETEVVIIERLGTITGVLDAADDRGLNVKPPWPIGTARRFDRRTQLFDPSGREVFTRDKKNVTVDAYVCWRLAEPAADQNLADRPVVRFFSSLGSERTAQARLETRVRSSLAAIIARVEMSNLMTVSDPESPPSNDAGDSLDAIAQRVLVDVRQRPDEEESVTQRLGIEVVDVRIKRINFPLGNQQAVFERMKSERQKIADRYRSAGLAENKVIRSKADRQYSEIMSKADGTAERIRGEAEAEALAILNQAHARDPEFYRTVRTLDSYSRILNEKTTLVLSASSSLLKMLVEGVPENETSQPSPLPRKGGSSLPVDATDSGNAPAAGESGASTVESQTGDAVPNAEAAANGGSD